MSGWFLAPFPDLVAVVLSAVGIYASLILFIRLSGLRSLSKMSSFDFATTVAMGSVMASTLLTEDPPLLQAVVGLGTLFALQYVVARYRQRVKGVAALVDNTPIVLMVGPTMLDENLRKTRVTEDDVWAKLREANVLDLREVRAVVLETTGDISVLHGAPDGTPLQPELLSGVRDRDRLTST